MYQFIEKSMRGGVVYVAQKYSKANNKYMKSYHKDKSSKCIIYDNANNLYGWAIPQYHPFVGFKWLTQGKIYRLVKNTIQNNNLESCLSEVDLECPERLQGLQSFSS